MQLFFELCGYTAPTKRKFEIKFEFNNELIDISFDHVIILCDTLSNKPAEKVFAIIDAFLQQIHKLNYILDLNCLIENSSLSQIISKEKWASLLHPIFHDTVMFNRLVKTDTLFLLPKQRGMLYDMIVTRLINFPEGCDVLKNRSFHPGILSKLIGLREVDAFRKRFLSRCVEEEPSQYNDENLVSLVEFCIQNATEEERLEYQLKTNPSLNYIFRSTRYM